MYASILTFVKLFGKIIDNKAKIKMSEIFEPTAMQTRLEHSRSIDDAERLRALYTLEKVGLLIPVTDIETYHGRLGSSNDESAWQVDPTFSNASNDSGNSNVNNRPTLYSGDKHVAIDFAQARGRETVRSILRELYKEKVRGYSLEERHEWLDRLNQEEQARWDGLNDDQRRLYPEGPRVYTSEDLIKEYMISVEALRFGKRLPNDERSAYWNQAAEGLKAEVHDIVASHPDATIFDLGFDSTKLGEADRSGYQKALATLLIPITEGSPVGFEHRDEFRLFAEIANRLRKYYLSTEDVAAMVAEAGMHEATASQLAGAYNARQLAAVVPSYLVMQLINHRHNMITDTFDVPGGKQEIPVNLEYVERYLRLAHIVGVRQSVDSATLGRDITSVSFFDLERIKTSDTLQSERSSVWERLGGTAAALSELSPVEAMPNDRLQTLLKDAHAKPEKLLEAAKLIEGYDEIFDADAGNWEGFTLGEHTETVLRNFDENFADKIPVQLLAPMRLAILSHDVGKPAAASRGEKHLQKKYNALQADDFLTKVGVDERLKEILLAVIGEGAELAYRIDIRGAGEEVEARLQNLARETLRQFSVDVENIEQQVAGFVEMCRMLQVCDGGAYTSMAITNRGNGRGRHRNAPSFNGSFAQPVDLGKRSIGIRKDGAKRAQHDLTPKTAKQQSRL